MENRHFTFLGYREYRLAGRKGREFLQPVKATGLGILRRGHSHSESTNRILPSDIRRQSRSRDLSLVTKANLLSTVHRSGYLDYVGIKNFDAKGRLIGERRFLGLWTSAAYNSNPREIPLLRQKVAQVTEHFALAPDSHDGKALQHILETFPRDELFQAECRELNRIVTGIFGLQDRPRVRVLLRRDPFRRFYSCLVFVPREKYNTQVRQRIERVIREAFSASSMESQVQIAESNLARIHIVARTSPDAKIHVDADGWSGASPRRCAPGWMPSRLRCWRASTKPTHCSCSTSMRRPFPPPTRRTFRPTPPPWMCPSSRRSRRSPPRLHLDIYRPDAGRKDKFFLKIFRVPGCDSDFRSAADAREHGPQGDRRTAL